MVVEWVPAVPSKKMNALQKFARRLSSFSAALLLTSSAAIVSAQSEEDKLARAGEDFAVALRELGEEAER